jgi:hypothetical protein
MIAGLIFDPDDKKENLLKNNNQINLQSNQSSIETFSPQYFSLEKIDFLSDISSPASLLTSTSYTIILAAGIILLVSLIVIAMLPQFTVRAKSTAILLFLAALSVIILGGISYNNLIGEVDSSTFGIQGYGVILVGLLLFVITAPFVHSKIKNLTNVYIFGFSILAILAVYFVGGNTFNVETDVSFYQPQIISDINVGDLSAVTYGEPKRFFGESLTSGYAQFAYSILFVFLFQFFTFIAMNHKNNYKSFSPLIYIVIAASLLWSVIFYSIGYSFYKILIVYVVGIPITPLVWQFMGVYVEKLSRDQQLSQWEEIK